MGLPNITYRVSYRNVKYPRLEFKTGRLLLILPFGHEHNLLLKKHRTWILRKIEFIEGCLKNSANKEISDRTNNELKDLVYSFATKYSKKLGIKLNHIYFRKMKSKWASCSSKGNLTINMLMRYLPEHLVEYIVFHETAHIIEKRHNEEFWGLVSKVFDNYQELEKDLFAYWFRVTDRK